MKETNQQNAGKNQKENSMANPGDGPQGVDKAPGEETSEDNVQFVQQTQKGKKVDGDPSLDSDKPIEQDI